MFQYDSKFKSNLKVLAAQLNLSKIVHAESFIYNLGAFCTRVKVGYDGLVHLWLTQTSSHLR